MDESEDFDPLEEASEREHKSLLIPSARNADTERHIWHREYIERPDTSHTPAGNLERSGGSVSPPPYHSNVRRNRRNSIERDHYPPRNVPDKSRHGRWSYHSDPWKSEYRTRVHDRTGPSYQGDVRESQPQVLQEDRDEQYEFQRHWFPPPPSTYPPPAVHHAAPIRPNQRQLSPVRYSEPPYHAFGPNPSRPARHYSPQDHLKHLGAYSDTASDNAESSSEDDEAWIDGGHVDPQNPIEQGSLLKHMDASQAVVFHSNVYRDYDLLNPSEWRRKLYVTESLVRQKHQHRLSWPDTWRHSNSKTCPQVLCNVWPNILEVDLRFGKLGLDAILPVIDTSIYSSKPKGTLSELMAAYTTGSLQKADATRRPTAPVSVLSTDSGSWDQTVEHTQDLLKVRDYLIEVCRDAESLNEMHPTMDAITWFEQAISVEKGGLRWNRPQVIELMSISLSHLARIIQSLNVILQALLWGWSDQSTICIHFDESIERHSKSTYMTMLEVTRSSEIAKGHYENGETRVWTCLHTLDLGLEDIINEVEMFSAILSQALFHQCDTHIHSGDSVIQPYVSYGRREYAGLIFAPRALNCMSPLIQGRRVSVLTRHRCSEDDYYYVSPTPFQDCRSPHEMSYRSPAYIRTTIANLARIWGPIWTASELGDGHVWHWYRLPGGYIGASEQTLRHEAIKPERDESLCHFSNSLKTFGKCPSPHFFLPDQPYLLIGRGLPATLVVPSLCQSTVETGLEGVALQPVGTLKPFKYKDGSAFNISVGHAGTQASWTTQIKTNPGILAKESLLQRWKLEPRFRNPQLLFLWYGVEVSLCTRNARRCRIVDLIRNHTMFQYISTIYRPELDSTAYKTALFKALKSHDVTAFLALYEDHPEWRGEVGAVVARCLDIFKETGVNRDGDLAAFTFIDKSHDSEQLAIFSKRNHTWIGLLKDSIDTVTFAVASDRCLQYSASPGQLCRWKSRLTYESKSVLETSYTATARTDMIRLFAMVKTNDRLTLQDSSKFRVKRRSSRGILLGAWEGGILRYLQIPRASEHIYREKRQDKEQAIKIFVVSQKKQRLARLKEPPSESPVITETPPTVSPNISNGDDMNAGSRILQHSIGKIPTHDGQQGGAKPINISSMGSSESMNNKASPSHKMSRNYVDESTQTDSPMKYRQSSDTSSSTPLNDLLRPTDSENRSNSSHRRRRHRSDASTSSSHSHHKGRPRSSDETFIESDLDSRRSSGIKLGFGAFSRS